MQSECQEEAGVAHRSDELMISASPCSHMLLFRIQHHSRSDTGSAEEAVEANWQRKPLAKV